MQDLYDAIDKMTEAELEDAREYYGKLLQRVEHRIKENIQAEAMERVTQAIVWVPAGWRREGASTVVNRCKMGLYQKVDFDKMRADIEAYLLEMYPNEDMTLERARGYVDITYGDADDKIVWAVTDWQK
jgi:uncharacterized protein (UPF0248 family)